jgi:hypothetical protein
MKTTKQLSGLHGKVWAAANKAMKDCLPKGNAGNPPLRKAGPKKPR